MAIQTRQDRLSINQVNYCSGEKSAQVLKVYHEGKVVGAVEEKRK